MPFPKPSRPSTLAHSGPHISMRRGQTTVVLRCLPRLLEPISRPSVPYAMRVQYMDAAGCSGSWECKSCSGGEKKSLVHPVLRLLGGTTQYWPVLTTSLDHQPLSSPPRCATRLHIVPPSHRSKNLLFIGHHAPASSFAWQKVGGQNYSSAMVGKGTAARRRTRAGGSHA